jgi:hypothetical protein
MIFELIIRLPYRKVKTGMVCLSLHQRDVPQSVPVQNSQGTIADLDDAVLAKLGHHL